MVVGAIDLSVSVQGPPLSDCTSLRPETTTESGEIISTQYLV